MKEEIIQTLQIIQIVLLCSVAFIFLTQDEKQIKRNEYLQKEINDMKIEIVNLQNELKHNDNIVLKVLEKEW